MHAFAIRKKLTVLLSAVLLVCFTAFPVKVEGTSIIMVIPENNEVEKNYPDDFGTLPEAERQQVEAAVNNIINSVKEQLTVQSSFNGSPTAAPNPTVTDVLGEGSYVDVQLVAVSPTIQRDATGTGSITTTVTDYTFDVTPYKVVDGNATAQHTLSKDITFRLPVIVDGFRYANTTHEGKYIGQYEVQGTYPNQYIEISSSDFSLYGYTLTNIKADNGSGSTDNSKTDYIVCPACGYHNWTFVEGKGYVCDHCGRVRGVIATTTAKASGRANPQTGIWN